MAEKAIFLGPVAPQSWLDTFMPASMYTEQRKPSAPALKKLMNVPIPGRCKESGPPTTVRDMYQPFCEFVNQRSVCPGFTGVSNETLDGPGIMLFSNADAKGNNCIVPAWQYCEVCIEFRPYPENSAFCDVETKPFLNEDGKSLDTREQIEDYASSTMSTQQRCFCFMIEICGEYVRFLRFDRAGCVVSEAFSFRKNPQLLCAFFLRLSTLSSEKRGHDPTVKRASTEQYEGLKTAIQLFALECRCKGRDPSFVQQTLEGDYIPYVVSVGSDKVIIRRPFFMYEAAFGRATRVYAAYSLTKRKLLCLKDAWRTNGDDVQTEEHIYEHLQAHDVPWLATNYYVGDVKVGAGKYARDQRAHTFTFKPPHSLLEFTRPCQPKMRSVVHSRLLQELGIPLKYVANSKEIVRAMRNALECAFTAYEKAQTLHRDMSSGNILIDDEGGFLNDWDHSFICSAKKDSAHSRTGTWQFLSIKFLRNPSKSHKLQDDVESAFWSLLYACLRYIRHDSPDFDLTFFHEKRRNADGDEIGGSQKLRLLASRELKKVTWSCKPLDALIHELADLFREYYVFHRKRDDSGKKDVERMKQAYEKIGDSAHILGLFDRALLEDGWLPHDRGCLSPGHAPPPKVKAESDSSDPLGPLLTYEEVWSNGSESSSSSLSSARSTPSRERAPSPSPDLPRLSTLTTPHLSSRRSSKRSRASAAGAGNAEDNDSEAQEEPPSRPMKKAK
ncbi:hypothetical protein K474DRAFT_1224555 [Panus rudis PR-1116 ss-1]|nr:hypothetical protein K474DRAFT_1224555 [Panus rudis PR-1116 ss-1]